MNIHEALSSNEADSRLLEALASLNQISATINRIGSDDVISSADSLRLIVESAIRVVPGSSAVIFTYDETRARFDGDSRVSTEPADSGMASTLNVDDDRPRQNGIGVRTVRRRRNVLSYEEPDLDIHPYHAALGVKAVGCFPLIVVDQVVGVLYIYLCEERPFTRLELLLLDNFVHQAAMAIYHTRRMENMRRDLEHKEDELNRLHRAGMLISSRLKLEETLESILQLALDMTGAHYGIFRLLDRSGENLVTRAFAGADMTRPKIETLPLNANSIMGQVARTRQPILISDLQSDTWSKIYYPLDVGLQMRSELAVPLINASGRLEGVLNLESPEPGAFNDNHSHMLQSMATYAVTAIQEVRLLDALLEVAHLIFSQPCQQVFNHLTGLACDLLNASSSALWLFRDEELVLEAASGGYRHVNKMPVTGSLAGQAILEREAVVANDVRTDSRFHRRDLAQLQNWARALVVPLLASDEEQPLGAFGVYSTETDPGRFAESDWDKKVLTFLARYAVLALQNENRQQALRSAQEQRSVAETFAAIGDIASNLLHQLNNKVGTIPVRIQGIQDKCQPSLNQDAYLATNLVEIERSANEAMAAVRDNLVHLRPMLLAEVDITACIRQAIETANLTDGVKVDLLPSACELPAVIAGERNLALVFVNLFENAADAMKGGGEITVSCRTRKRMVEITVRDSGPGIPPELHERIFDLNYSGRRQTRPGKLGFGLWWVKTVMARLGGSISVESDGVQGTTFRLKIPVASDER